MSDSPFGGMFQDVFALLAQQGPDAWLQSASQLALAIARGEDGDPNPSPLERQSLESFAPLVGRHLDALFAVAHAPDVTAVNRSALTVAALAQWQPLLDPLVHAPRTFGTELASDENPMMAQMAATLGPLFTGLQLGSVAGHFAERAWSLAVMPLPRRNGEHLIVVNNLKAFADAWSLTTDEVYVFALAQEFTASLILSQPGTGDALRALLIDAVRESAAAQGDLLQRLQGLMQNGDVGEIMAHPESLLDGIGTPEASVATNAVNAAGAALLAVFDATAFAITESLLGPRTALREAYRRHRLSDARGEDAAAALFGFDPHGSFHAQAHDFVATLSERHGLEVLNALLRVDGLPSPHELAAPDQWWSRVTSSPLA